MTIVRENLLNIKYYSPYCGNTNCPKTPRTEFNGFQFYCDYCGWKSKFPKDFIKQYKERWGLS